MFLHLVFLISSFWKILTGFSLLSAIRDLTIRGQRRQQKRRWKYLRYFNLHHDYSKSLTWSNVGEPSVFPPFHIEFRKRRKFRRRLCTSSVKREISSCVEAAHTVSPDWSQKTMTCHSFNCFSIVWGQSRHHWWLLFRAAATWPKLRHFHVVVVQRRQRIVQKSVMHVQNCRFGY